VGPRISQKVAVGTVFVAAMFMSILDATIVNVALPTIGRDFGVSATAVDGIAIAFLVSLAIFIPASGWLGDKYGGKRVLLTAIVLFTAASALCGVASSLPELVAFRIFQGAAGGMLAPVGMAMLYRVFPPDERIRAAAILTVPTTLAPALGPVLGGLFVTELSWRWVFYVNVPIGVAAFAFGAVFVHQPPQAEPGRFDLPGFLLAGSGLGLLMYGVSEGPDLGWDDPQVLASIAAGVVLLAAMVIVELRSTAPIVDLRLLGNRLFRAGNGVMVLASVAFLGTLYAISLYFQDGRGLSALAAGLSIFPEAFGVMAGAQLASRVLYPRLGPRRHITIGLAGTTISIGLLALMGPQTSLWWARLLMLTLGLSMAQVFVPVQAASFATITPAATGRASTMFNTVRQLGGAVGVAVLTTVIVLIGPVHRVGGHEAANLTAYRVAFLAAAVICVCAVACSLSIRDADAASTIPARRSQEGEAAPAVAALQSRESHWSVQVDDGGAVGLRAAGQALGRIGPAVVQVRVVLPAGADPAEQLGGRFGHRPVGLAGPQGGDVRRHRGLVAAVGGRDGGGPGGRRDLLELREHVHAGLRERRERAVRRPEPLTVLGVGDRGVQAPADAADGLGRGGEQEVALGLIQGGGGDLPLGQQDGGHLVERGDADPPGQVQAQLTGGGEAQRPGLGQEDAQAIVGDGRHHDDVGHVGGHHEPAVAVEPPPARGPDRPDHVRSR
jgi:EmrB/QacA subfamily drug resistance transporter